ncbi:Inositol-3-phosphate synthase [Venturia inaequalis]|nr:Inositol-3-phosphate synthase [Venturia inaequalis]
MKVIFLSTALLMAVTAMAADHADPPSEHGLRTACVKGPPNKRLPGSCVVYDEDSFGIYEQPCRDVYLTLSFSFCYSLPSPPFPYLFDRREVR